LGPCGLVCIILLATTSTLALNGERRFELIDKGYEFSLQTKTSLCPDSVLELLFQYSHIVKYTSGGGTMRITRQEKDMYEVEVETRYPMYSSVMVYRRQINRTEQTVTIDLVDFKQKQGVFPAMVGSESCYKVEKAGDSTLIIYNQRVHFNGKVNWIWMKIVKGRLYGFSDELLSYLDKMKSSKDHARAGKPAWREIKRHN
jgi:hypothetical protein